MPTLYFTSILQLRKLIDNYFSRLEGQQREIEKPLKEDKSNPDTDKVRIREPEPPTITGFMLFLGFNNRQLFDKYCAEGEFADLLNEGRLRIEACYEKKLHNQSATGAMFALKNMGWNEKPEPLSKIAEVFNTLKIELIETGPTLASSEKEVQL